MNAPLRAIMGYGLMWKPNAGRSMRNDYIAIDRAALLNAVQAQTATPAQQTAWTSAARRILRQPEEVIDGLPLDQQLSLCAATYAFPWERLGGFRPQFGAWGQVAEKLQQTDAPTRAVMADDFALQIKALKTARLSTGYFDFMDALHERAYGNLLRVPGAKALLSQWGNLATTDFLDKRTGAYREDGTGRLLHIEDGSQPGKQLMTVAARATLDQHGITHEKSVWLMNQAAQAMQQAWETQARGLGIAPGDKPAMRTIGFNWAGSAAQQRETECLVMKDAVGQYYGISDRHPSLLDPRGALHVAFHEPQHDIQGRLAVYARMTQQAPILSDAHLALIHAGKIFGYQEDFRVVSAPSTVFAGVPELKNAAYQAYLENQGERAGFYQGNKAGSSIGCDFLPTTPIPGIYFLQSPALLRQPDSAPVRFPAASAGIKSTIGALMRRFGHNRP